MTVIQAMKKINKRIPGLLPPPPKTEVDGKITDLSSKTISELLELKERQLKLINNKAFICKLADRGEKLKLFYEKILNNLKEKEEEERTCHLFNKLNLGVDKQSVQNVEWEGKLASKENEYLDSDDDSEPEDVLHILSQSTSLEKKVKVLPPEKALITTEDLNSITEMPHVRYIVEKTENNPKPKPTGQFKPFKTTKSDVHNPEKEIHRKRHKNWEVTSATPPPIVHGPAKLLTLEESLKLQKDHNIHLKEIEAQNAAEKLLARAGIKMSELPADTSKFGGYREADSDDSEASDVEGSDKEVHDEEPERGGVVFTVMK
ncbi:DNA-directed RNA polymerase II subunit GRINL1A [Plodia interpunctella]|uniref:DNA-directed RNA polymerase II subunit GRINL1A n=1 Tax=Plodia interpunctella TaxID=58824 RepID=UPI0023676FF4|nr:DNA-directed RNA polymerase II subunit GRINL1A [Plodia interpunctella]